MGNDEHSPRLFIPQDELDQADNDDSRLNKENPIVHINVEGASHVVRRQFPHLFSDDNCDAEAIAARSFTTADSLCAAGILNYVTESIQTWRKSHPLVSPFSVTLQPPHDPQYYHVMAVLLEDVSEEVHMSLQRELQQFIHWIFSDYACRAFLLEHSSNHWRNYAAFESNDAHIIAGP